MAVYLDEKEEQKRREELEQYSAQTQEKIDTDNINAKARRNSSDKKFRTYFFGMIIVVLLIVTIRWLM